MTDIDTDTQISKRLTGHGAVDSLAKNIEIDADSSPSPGDAVSEAKEAVQAPTTVSNKKEDSNGKMEKKASQRDLERTTTGRNEKEEKVEAANDNDYPLSDTRGGIGATTATTTIITTMTSVDTMVESDVNPTKTSTNDSNANKSTSKTVYPSGGGNKNVNINIDSMGIPDSALLGKRVSFHDDVIDKENSKKKSVEEATGNKTKSKISLLPMEEAERVKTLGAEKTLEFNAKTHRFSHRFVNPEQEQVFVHYVHVLFGDGICSSILVLVSCCYHCVHYLYFMSL
ncbi:hypothetical protein RFI_22855 [Reticulomyxa filosa]|uniref:Uncharacterized protein n=1 Tax=Reticulomyxa filosa TaxID=46433 RepID=X6MN45_RETFI|nr:hypothetical protein RFI_22855 [Reticulomyxa filosa]|eukprot:ETO14515.1 hypothetical protein RFI_22855 [Reticulomyxa filosa]